MRILKVLRNNARNIAIAGTMLAGVTVPKALYGQNTVAQKPDTFVKTVPPEGTKAPSVLAGAPSPKVVIAGKNRTASIVVDLKKNVLYKYNKQGQAEGAYLVASGKQSTPTHRGVRVVDHIEKYPYQTAYGTKRKRNPNAYGPYILVLKLVDTKTGAKRDNGEYVHGHDEIKSPDCLGKYVSHGCVRMDNNVITWFATEEIKPGEVVIFTR